MKLKILVQLLYSFFREMTILKFRQYGLILKKENASFSASSKVAAVFGDDEEEAVDTEVMTGFCCEK